MPAGIGSVSLTETEEPDKQEVFATTYLVLIICQWLQTSYIWTDRTLEEPYMVDTTASPF